MKSALLAPLALLALALPVGAPDRRFSHGIAIAAAAPGIGSVQTARGTDPVPERALRISYPGPTAFRPDAVTMNRSHSSHWSDALDGMDHVFRGWTRFWPACRLGF